MLTEWNEKRFAVTQIFDSKVISELAECHALNGNYEGALSAYTMLTAAEPGNLYFALQKAMILYKTEDFAAAAVAGKEALERDTASVAMLTLVGNSFNKMGKGDSALVYYDRVLRLKPMDVATINKMSNVLFSDGKAEEVVTLTENYLARDSTNLMINPIYGLALHMCKKYPESLEAFFKQLRLGDESYGTYYYLGLNYFLMDKKFNAEQYFEKAYQIDSSDVNLVYYYAASKAWQTYRFDEAKELFDMALKMMQLDSMMMYKIYGGYGLGYYQSGDFEKALKYYRLSYEQNPGFASAVKVIGYCYEKLEKFAEAQKWYKRYLKKLGGGKDGETEMNEGKLKAEREWVEGKIAEMEGEKFIRE